MANCPPYACYDPWTDAGDLELCPSQVSGGINAAILLRCGITPADVLEDYNTDALDNDKIEALIANGDAKLVQGIQVTLNAPSELTAATGDPCNPEAPSNYDRSLTWQDYNVNRVRSLFYDSINAVSGYPLGGVILNHCEPDKTTYISNRIRFSGGRQSPEDNTTNAFYEFNVTWRNKKDAGLFDQTLDVFN
jgi:hypothetical protein